MHPVLPPLSLHAVLPLWAAVALFNLRLGVRGVAHVHGQRHLLHEVAVLEEGGGDRARAVVQRHDVEARLALGQAIGGDAQRAHRVVDAERSEEHTSELQSLMRISYAVFCLKKKTKIE